MIQSTPTFHNSLQSQPWQPSSNNIGLYLCGLTVYDLCHIGNARTMLTFDTIVRYLRHRGYQVTFVRNITDVDDKIIDKAVAQNCSYKHIAEHFIEQMDRDFAQLELLAPDHEPRASDAIDAMQAIINKLEESGIAYQSETDGDVYYAVGKFNDYGQLSGQNLSKLQVGSRVDVDANKHSPHDFVLWKKQDDPSVQTGAVWPSKWGIGRPGWHLECSALAQLTLGDSFEIHGGGIDLKFPHHENEKAQSEGCGHSFAQCWLHGAHLTFGEEKMSKSVGNIVTLRKVLEQWSANEIKFALLSAHYRSTLEFTNKLMEASRKALANLSKSIVTATSQPQQLEQISQQLQQQISQLSSEYYRALDDDFNTPKAISILFDITRLKSQTDAEVGFISNRLRYLAAAIGLDLQSLQVSKNMVDYQSEAFKHIPILESVEQALDYITEWKVNGNKQKLADNIKVIELMIAIRGQAKLRRYYGIADAVRLELLTLGIKIEDISDTQALWFPSE